MNHENDIGERGPVGQRAWDDVLRAEEELLARAREVAQEITQRVKKVLDETEPHVTLPTEPTKENPPVT
jgi:hypothetical protein